MAAGGDLASALAAEPAAGGRGWESNRQRIRVVRVPEPRGAQPLLDFPRGGARRTDRGGTTTRNVRHGSSGAGLLPERPNLPGEIGNHLPQRPECHRFRPHLGVSLAAAFFVLAHRGKSLPRERWWRQPNSGCPPNTLGHNPHARIFYMAPRPLSQLWRPLVPHTAGDLRYRYRLRRSLGAAARNAQQRRGFGSEDRRAEGPPDQLNITAIGRRRDRHFEGTIRVEVHKFFLIFPQLAQTYSNLGE